MNNENVDQQEPRPVLLRRCMGSVTVEDNVTLDFEDGYVYTYNPPILFLRTCPKYTLAYVYQYAITYIFLSVLFTMAKIWKELKCSLTGK